MNVFLEGGRCSWHKCKLIRVIRIKKMSVVDIYVAYCLKKEEKSLAWSVQTFAKPNHCTGGGREVFLCSEEALGWVKYTSTINKC